MTTLQQELPLQESEATFILVHLIDNEPTINKAKAPTGSFDEVKLARQFVVDTSQKMMDAGVSKYEVEWELAPRPTGWYGIERKDGRTIVHELRVEKVK